MVAHARRQKSRRSASSPGARVGTAGAAARNESAQKCWRWLAEQEVKLTAMVPIELPVLGHLACRLLVQVLVLVAGVNELSVPVPVPRRSAPTVVPHAETKHKVLGLMMMMFITITARD